MTHEGEEGASAHPVEVNTERARVRRRRCRGRATSPPNLEGRESRPRAGRYAPSACHLSTRGGRYHPQPLANLRERRLFFPSHRVTGRLSWAKIVLPGEDQVSVSVPLRVAIIAERISGNIP